MIYRLTNCFVYNKPESGCLKLPKTICKPRLRLLEKQEKIASDFAMVF